MARTSSDENVAKFVAEIARSCADDSAATWFDVSAAASSVPSFASWKVDSPAIALALICAISSELIATSAVVVNEPS